MTFNEFKEWVKEHKVELAIGAVGVVAGGILGYRIANRYIADRKYVAAAKARIDELTGKLADELADGLAGKRFDIQNADAYAELYPDFKPNDWMSLRSMKYYAYARDDWNDLGVGRMDHLLKGGHDSVIAIRDVTADMFGKIGEVTEDKLFPEGEKADVFMHVFFK